MQIQLDFRSGQPIYTQLVEQIRQMIVTGELKVGDQLPTVRQLATDLRVNFNTVARAYRLLDEAGLISTQHGRGTYIWEAPSDKTLEQLRRQSFRDLTDRYVSEALHLGYSEEDVIRAVKEKLESNKSDQVNNSGGIND